MAVRKTDRTEKPPSAESFIEGGAGKTDTATAGRTGDVPVRIRIPAELVEAVDAQRHPTGPQVRLSRNQWITEAILEKLDRDGKARS